VSTGVQLIHGDCLDALPRLAEDGVRVDAVVTDPPYHLASIVSRLGSPDAAPIQSGATGVYARSSSGFMGQQWDGGDVAFRADTWRKVFAVMRPGAHLVAFGGTRTYYRMATAIEDAGFEIRDQLGWLYGTGFPKSHNLAGEHDGWGTALKPAWEPIAFARKPLIGSVPENVSQFGTGAINIDGCRVPIGAEKFDGGGQNRNGVRPDTHNEGWRRPWMEDPAAVAAHQERLNAGVERARELGRWPANVLHDGSDEVLAAFPRTASGAAAVKRASGADVDGNRGSALGAESRPAGTQMIGYADAGNASRFFYCAKATAEDRAGSEHPTVKPISLMRWLARLICPPGGLVLDPFAGTGTTGAAAIAEGMQALLIERSDAYAEDIARRFKSTVADLSIHPVRGREPTPPSAGPLFGAVA
jgi:site-specific DNA-methyltransferase (adenine-specific)